MARFYTTTDNSRVNTVSAMSHKGQTTHTRGWNSGVQVISHIDEHDRDVFDIYRTGGSNASLSPRLIGRVVADTFIPAESEALEELRRLAEVETLEGAWTAETANERCQRYAELVDQL